MKKYTAEEKQAALEMMNSQGTNYTSRTLRITKNTLYRWKHEAAFAPLMPPTEQTRLEEIDAQDEAPAEILSVEEPVSEDATETAMVPIPVPLPSAQGDVALEEAVETIQFLTKENARLIEVIRQLRAVIRSMAEVV